MLFLSVERVNTPAKGRYDGFDGAKGRIRIGDGPDLPSKGEFRIAPGDTLIFETPGGGGFGPPSERSRTAVQHDVEAGHVSKDAAQAMYGTKP